MWSIACIKYIRYTTVQDCFTCLLHAKELTFPGTSSLQVAFASCYLAMPAPLYFGCGNSFFVFWGGVVTLNLVLCHFQEFPHEIETQLPTVVAGLMVNPVSTPFLPCISSLHLYWYSSTSHIHSNPYMEVCFRGNHYYLILNSHWAFFFFKISDLLKKRRQFSCFFMMSFNFFLHS